MVLVEDGGLRLLEGSPDEHFMSDVEDASRLIDASRSGRLAEANRGRSKLTKG